MKETDEVVCIGFVKFCVHAMTLCSDGNIL